MEFLIENIINKIALLNPAHAEKIQHNIHDVKNELFKDSELFFSKYKDYLKRNNLTLDFGVDCYLKLHNGMLEERWKFIKKGTYSNTSFKEVENSIYGNDETMTSHMNGLVLAQFLWFEQYDRFCFFKNNLLQYVSKPKTYLEIGGGHGLYMLKALELLPSSCQFDLIDVSKSSIKLSKGIINNLKVNYINKNIFDLDDNINIDFFTMGEMLEHLENPLQMLKKLKQLIKKTGKGYITTPINSPMIDHIYLFNNAEEIRKLFKDAGLKIIKEKITISEHISPEIAKKHRVPIMYAAFVQSY